MKNFLKTHIFWTVLISLGISLLDVLPYEALLEEADTPYLGIGILVLSLLSFIATVLVFWVAYFAHGKLVTLILVSSWILPVFLPDNFYLLGTLVVIGYWIYLKPEIQKYALRT